MHSELAIPSVEFYVESCAKAFLDGQMSLVWITKTLERSGVTRQRTEELLRPLQNHGNHRRARQLFGWLASAAW